MLRIRFSLSHRFILFRSLSTTPIPYANSACSAKEQQSLDNARPFSEIPTPGGAVPFLGHLSLLRKFGSGDGMTEVFKKLYKEFGPIVRIRTPIGTSDMVLIFNPTENETVLRNEGQYPVRSKHSSNRMQQFYKDVNYPPSFAFVDGQEWKDVRVLHHKQIRPVNVHGYSSGINRATNRLLTTLEASRNKEGYVDDIYPHVINWTMEASAWFTFGADLDLTKGDSEEAVHFQQAVQTFIGSIGYLTTQLALYKIYPTQRYLKAKEAFLTMVSLGRKFLDQSRKDATGKVKEGESASLLDQWMMDGKMTEDQCITSAIEMLSAGVDTTANLSTFLLYEVAKHSEVQEKIRQQVVSVLGEEGEADAESLQKMPYLNNAIKETARLNDVIQGSARDLPQDTEVMGYLIPAKTSIIYSYSTRKDFCKEPERFYPDRWSRDDEYKPHPFSVLPFGFGPRACFGRRFAELEMKVLLTKMCRHFNMTVDGPPNTRLPIKREFIGRPGVPLMMKLSRKRV